ncbi:hypothetical protein [Pelagicoccus sp. SDUM812003]|uniref:hypothetical protein n=1 Tax=Pelagicoccus sp. SDUM812003 TaxID=3041267 RepID=UPI0028107EC2|nr:hypothetical protein [Pelagicoccus sp. SDUM812003]MDQ8203915.1 hypothetical protein [Pelagicoccus sp. SDUM812003]
MDRRETLVTAGEELVPLPEKRWLNMARAHEAAVGPWIDAYRDRRASRQKHPVHDFLFEYYQVKRHVLRRWRPTVDQVLQGEAARSFLEDDRYRETTDGVRLDRSRLDESTRAMMEWTCQLIRRAQSRPPRFNCFGLHEWAMVYKAEDVRHRQVPLRLSQSEVNAVVEGSSIRCTHFDAFRFFTAPAAPRNEFQPTREDRLEMEQFGCIHFNMDLYRWSAKLCPWLGSDLIRDSFLLAMRAREVDMRASPYELSDYGYEPILIETVEGRDQYKKEQEAIYECGQRLAQRFLQLCDRVLA